MCFVHPAPRGDQLIPEYNSHRLDQVTSLLNEVHVVIDNIEPVAFDRLNML